MRIPLDKQAHCLSGYALVVTIFPLSIWLAIAVVIFVSIAKEVYDYKFPRYHTADKMDAAATLVGGSIGCLVMLLMGYVV